MKQFFIFLFLASFSAKAQQTSFPLSVSVFNNGTSLPGTGYAGLFSKTIHPGIDFGTYHLYRKKERTELYQTLKLGYFYHHLAQHAIQLYSELGYRYFIKSGFYGEGRLGAGYLHSFADVEQFKWEDGKYVKKANFGRPQLMITASLALGYNFQTRSKMPLSLFLEYQFWMQTPFVKKYVPLLPNAALHLGAIYQIPKHQSSTKK